MTVEAMEASLGEQFEEAQIDFRGISPEMVEVAAVRYYAPGICAQQSQAIRDLFSPRPPEP